jgi:hypothetical protein
MMKEEGRGREKMGEEERKRKGFRVIMTKKAACLFS